MEIIPAFVLSVLASFFPQCIALPTVGMSGFLFALFGIMWGRYGKFLQAVKVVMPFIVITMILPNVNGLLHLYTFLLGYGYGFCKSHS